MKTQSGLFLLGVMFLSCSSDYPFFSAVKADGPNVREKITLDDFNSLDLMISANVEIKLGERQEVEIEAPQNLIDLLNRDVDGKTWKIKFDKNVRYAEKINLYITVKEFNSATVSGSGSIQGLNDFKTNVTSNFINSGSGNIDLSMESPEIKAVISGSGKIKLNGQTRALNAAISGSGDIEAYKLNAEDVTIAITGSGDGYFDVTKTLKATIVGSGSIYYLGNPKIEASITGSGKVKPGK
jgi:hypothetical protein